VGRLDALLARLRAEGVPAEVGERLRLLLAEAPDEDVAGMRPLELAGRWGTDPGATLEAFLQATVAGLLEVRWELLCPGCRGIKAEARHLRELQTTGECPACNLHFAADVDEAIEARFYPAPSVRAVDVGTYCVGGPMSTPHRLAHILLRPGEAREWRLGLAPGPYILRSPQSRGASRLLVQSGAGPGEGEARRSGARRGEGEARRSGAGPGEADAQIAGTGRPRVEPEGGPEGLEVRIEPAAIGPDEARLAAGQCTIRLANGTPDRVTVALDDARWPEGGATPSRLMLLPAFHQLFSAEALAPGVELAIGRVGLLFTDLAGSTALYEAAGDARAFRLVGEHFAIVQGAVEAAGGAMVKTIGDAVMAAFPDGRAAVAAGLAIQREIRALETGGWADPARLIKVGVHAGACFAVTLNERLDYFGTAVNLAARAQHEARGGEVVATAAAFDEVAAEVAAAGLAGEAFEASLRGLRDPVRLYRIDCQPIGELAPA
jgi:class 3 adenylate cyclase